MTVVVKLDQRCPRVECMRQTTLKSFVCVPISIPFWVIDRLDTNKSPVSKSAVVVGRDGGPPPRQRNGKEPIQCAGTRHVFRQPTYSTNTTPSPDPSPPIKKPIARKAFCNLFDCSQGPKPKKNRLSEPKRTKQASATTFGPSSLFHNHDHAFQSTHRVCCSCGLAGRAHRVGSLGAGSASRSRRVAVPFVAVCHLLAEQRGGKK